MHTPFFSIFVAITIVPEVVKAWLATSSPCHRRGARLSGTTMNAQAHSPKSVVIVGGGIGGLSSAYDARHILHPTDKVTVVSANDLFQFTPSNPWVAIRKRSADDISLPLHRILPKYKIDFIHGTAVKLDPKEQLLTLQDGKIVSYDYLIIATGPKLGFDEVPGMREWSASICTTPHAASTAEALDRIVKEPGPIVIGATQGASCFGPAYEFALLVHFELQRRGGNALLDQCKITFVTPEPYIGHLGLGGAGKSKEILERSLKARNIDYITNCRVNRVSSDSVTIEHYTGNKNATEQKTLSSKFTMLIPPFRGHSVWASVPGLTDKNGMIAVNAQQQSRAFPTIFGVGVCVSFPPLEKTMVPTGVPKTGYMIESMGTAAVKNIKFLINDSPTNEFVALPHIPTLNGLCITDFGEDGAIFLTLPQIPPRRLDVTLNGKVATLGKIAFERYFLHKIESGDTDPYYEKYLLHLIGIDRTLTQPSTLSEGQPA